MNIIDCFQQGIRKVKAVVRPCQTAAKLWPLIKKAIICEFPNTKNYIHSTTITLGVKWINRLSHDDKYRALRKAIKKHISDITRSNKDARFYYTFEESDTGVFHAHGLEIGTYRARFIESFSMYGRHNAHEKAFELTKDVNAYMDYICKDVAKNKKWLPVTNFTKKELRNILYKHPQKGEGAEERSSSPELEQSS